MPCYFWAINLLSILLEFRNDEAHWIIRVSFIHVIEMLSCFLTFCITAAINPFLEILNCSFIVYVRNESACVNSADVDPGFWDDDPPAKQASKY